MANLLKKLYFFIHIS